MSSTATYTFNGNDVDIEWPFPLYTGTPVVEVNGDPHAFTEEADSRIALTLDPGDPEASPDPIPAEEPPTRSDVITVTLALVAATGA